MGGSDVFRQKGFHRRTRGLLESECVGGAGYIVLLLHGRSLEGVKRGGKARENRMCWR